MSVQANKLIGESCHFLASGA